nr:immunoglobulin heavy chain junction region [Homo sapiens]
VTISVDTSKNQ